MTNFVKVYDLIKKSESEKFDTTSLLVEYYKAEGFNIFKASEYAEKTLEIFVDSINREIADYNSKNVLCLFSDANKKVILVNRDFFVVEEIKNTLHSITDNEFEILCAQLFRQCFGAAPYVTKSKGDGGYDFGGTITISDKGKKFVLSKIEFFGQSKRYTGNITRPQIDEFVGFVERNKKNLVDKPVLYVYATTSDYSKDALKAAEGKNIICLNGFQMATLIFTNSNHKWHKLEELIGWYLHQAK